MKLSNKDSDGTSWFMDTFVTTVRCLRERVGNPQCEYNTGEDKVNFDWTCETSSGEVFTIYDWKHYKPLLEDELIRFHIGGHSQKVTRQAVDELNELFDRL